MGLTKMRVLFVIDQFEIGGAERQLIELCKCLPRDEFDIYVYSVVAGGHLEDEFVQAGATIYPYTRSRKLDYVAITQLTRLIREWDIDIVHSWLWYSNVVTYLATRLAKKVVWIASVHGIHLHFGRWHDRVERMVYRAADHITTISQFNRRILIDEKGVDNDKVTVLYNGIKVQSEPKVADSVSISGLPIKEGNFAIGCVANFGEEKGHSILIKAVAIVVEKMADVRVLLIGDGPLRSQIERDINALSLTQHVHLLGRRDDVLQILPRLDLAVLPSLLEGMPVAILEYMVAGLPVVATRVGGIPEAIEENETGILVAPDDPPQLAEAILSIAEDPVRRAEMGAAAYQRVCDLFTIDRSVTAYKSFYHRCFAQRAYR